MKFESPWLWPWRKPTPTDKQAASEADQKLKATVRKAGLRAFYTFDLGAKPWAAALALDRKGRPVGVLPGALQMLSFADSMDWFDRYESIAYGHSTENVAALEKWRGLIQAALRKLNV